ncbi:NnrS family protein [Rhizobium terrae]|uniref:NnrS family protein n=1 Tax=Rhizobium terrae TaxID=2171756 RepID=UPI000E3C74EF|nr:NnrS family protein [Rhizobium terrae]
MTSDLSSVHAPRRTWLAAASHEGLRLFFPLAAFHAALWPLLWVMLWKFDLPFSGGAVPAHWHAHEMIVGSYGAALIGFLTSALPEWTDTPRLHGRPLILLAFLWSVGRISGLLGAPAMIPIGALADQAWFAFLIAYLIFLSWRRRTTGLTGFIAFLAVLAAAGGMLRFSLFQNDFDLGERAVWMATLAFLGLLGLALARITVPVTNLILDPSEATSPFRPHPGRVNLAPGLVGLLLAAYLCGATETVRGYLMLAAGAAFLDRVADGFVGRETARIEIAALWISSGLAGIGLLFGGLSWIGLPFSLIGCLHLMLMGGLGIGILAVFSIAGLLHTSRPLIFSPRTKLAFLFMLVAIFLRTFPEFFPDVLPSSVPHGVTAAFWTGSLMLWLAAYLPLLWSPKTLDGQSC